MERIININGRTGRFDIPSFLLTENEPLTLVFNFNNAYVGKYVATLICGERTRVHTLGKDRRIDVPADWLQGDVLSILLELRNVNGNAIIISNDPSKGGYCIEPLQLEHVNENTVAVAWMTKLEGQMKTLQDKVQELSTAVSAIPAAIEKAKDEAVVAATGGDPMGA